MIIVKKKNISIPIFIQRKDIYRYKSKKNILRSDYNVIYFYSQLYELYIFRTNASIW